MLPRFALCCGTWGSFRPPSKRNSLFTVKEYLVYFFGHADSHFSRRHQNGFNVVPLTLGLINFHLVGFSSVEFFSI